jgi:UDP-N-acetyl-D-mannosaminuronic acid transferase (WecB/TagA/CpsF family)
MVVRPPEKIQVAAHRGGLHKDTMEEELKNILGLRFYVGSLQGLLARTLRGGLIVVPSAPVLVDLANDDAHREAMEGSDVAITDSGFFVILWLIFKGERLPRISGLRFLRALLLFPEFRRSGATFWVMPSADDSRANREWLSGQGMPVGADNCYVAPIYPAGRLRDDELVAQIEKKRPAYVILNIRGGVQERLGFFLISRLSYRPAIICTGAAIAFLSNRQVGIPVWADRLMLGWLLRALHSPIGFFPKIRKGLRLVPMVMRAEAGRP